MPLADVKCQHIRLLHIYYNLADESKKNITITQLSKTRHIGPHSAEYRTGEEKRNFCQICIYAILKLGRLGCLDKTSNCKNLVTMRNFAKN